MRKTLMVAGIALAMTLTTAPAMAAGAPGAHLIAQAMEKTRAQQAESDRYKAKGERLKELVMRHTVGDQCAVE
jgi:hypothetical protein